MIIREDLGLLVTADDMTGMFKEQVGGAGTPAGDPHLYMKAHRDLRKCIRNS